MTYTLTAGTAIIRDDGAFVPTDPGNADYQAYQVWLAAGNTPNPYVAPPPPPAQVMSQDIMAQFTAADATLIQAAIAGNAQFWLLWSAMQAQSDPMVVTNARFLTGWAALTQVLGAPRMAAIATALGITVG